MRAITLTERELHMACERERGIILRPALSPEKAPITSSPYGALHESLRVQERLWISDCGKYYAQDARKSSGEWAYDVITIDGSQRWLEGRYVPKGWNDTDPRYLYPEFPHMMSSWSNRGQTLKSGRHIKAFQLGFGDYDTSVRIQPLTGNTQRASYSAVFQRRIRGSQMPRWAERLSIILTEIAIRPFEDVLHGRKSDWQFLYWTFRDHYGDRLIERNPFVWELSYRRLSLKDYAEGMCPHDLQSNNGAQESTVPPGPAKCT